MPTDLGDKCRKLWHPTSVATLTDTHGFVKGLVKAGIPENQAEAIAEGLKLNMSEVATKADLRDLEIRILKWMIPLMVGQVAAFGMVVKWLVG